MSTLLILVCFHGGLWGTVALVTLLDPRPRLPRQPARTPLAAAPAPGAAPEPASHHGEDLDRAA